MWSYWICDTITGDKLLPVEPSTGGWSRLLNTDGTGQYAFPFTNSGIPIDTWQDITRPWARTVVQCWDDAPVCAGLITARPRKRDVVTLQTTDLRQLFMARYPFGVTSYWEDEGAGVVGKLTITSKSLVSAFGLVLEQGMEGPSGLTYSLPVVLPSLTESGTFSTVYDNFNFQKVYDILTELQSMDGGPDTEFAPQWSTSGRLEWVVRAGALTGGTFEFNPNADESPVISWEIDDDGAKQATGIFGIGQGSGPTMVIGGTPHAPTDAIPARDDVATWRMVTTNDQAASLARERLAAFKDTTIAPTLTVDAAQVSPLDLVLGSTVRLYGADPFYPDQWSEYRLVGISGGLGMSVTLNLMGARG